MFFGECMLETHNDDHFHFGGDTLNTALYLARTTKRDDVTVYYATALGTDHLSDKLLQCWQEEELDTSYVSQLADKDVGSYSIQTDKNGERRFIYDRQNSAARFYMREQYTPFSLALIHKNVDYFYLSGISLAILSNTDRVKLFALLTTFKNKGGIIIFDNNYREVLWQDEEALGCYQQIMQIANLVFLTDEDEYALYGGSTIESIFARTDQWQIPEVVIKQGADPCIIKTNNKQSIVDSMSLEKGKIVDTCAAGDAFSAGYLSKRLRGESEEISAQFAHKLAGEVIQHSGAIIPKSKMFYLVS